MLRVKDGRWSSTPLQRKAREGFQQHGQGDGYKQDAQHAKRGEAQEQRLKAPAGNPIGHEHDEETGRQD
jgi:hypothetical protein